MLLKVVVEESLEYKKVFDEVFYNHLENADLLSVDSDGSGSLELIYSVTMRKGHPEPALLIDLRHVHDSVKAQLIHGHAISL